jgi:hypothetical protein
VRETERRQRRSDHMNNNTHIHVSAEEPERMEEGELSYDEVEEVVGGLDHGWWPERGSSDDGPPLF